MSPSPIESLDLYSVLKEKTTLPEALMLLFHAEVSRMKEPVERVQTEDYGKFAILLSVPTKERTVEVYSILNTRSSTFGIHSLQIPLVQEVQRVARKRYSFDDIHLQAAMAKLNRDQFDGNKEAEHIYGNILPWKFGSQVEDFVFTSGMSQGSHEDYDYLAIRRTQFLGLNEGEAALNAEFSMVKIASDLRSSRDTRLFSGFTFLEGLQDQLGIVATPVSSAEQKDLIKDAFLPII